MCIDASKALPLQQYSANKHNNALTRNDALDIFTVTAEQLRQFAAQSAQVPVRADLFAKNQFSILDVMLYVSAKRDDFELTLGEFDPSLGTYPFSVSYDYDRDGVFDATLDGQENVNSPDWYAAFLYNGGEFKRATGLPSHEPLYDRLDEFLIRDGLHIRIQPQAKQMTERRQQVQAAEVARLKANGGVPVLPQLRVNFGDGRGYVTVATDVEVKPFNLRPDLFQTGTLTMADALMSAVEQHSVDIEFTFWPSMSTKADVDSYAVSVIDGQRAGGLAGWAFTSGELDNESDFFYGPEWPLASMLVANDQAGGGPFFGKCPWLTKQNAGKHTLETAQICIDNWFGKFGGNNIHRMTDTGIMRYPKESISFKWHNIMYDKFEPAHRNQVNDGRFEVFDINQAVAPLNNQHFGWGIADCGQCHSLDNTHLQGDSPVLADVVEPYYCASCHGSNGAPKGHGETARCFWCHSEQEAMVNHGDASRWKRVAEISCSGTTTGGTSLDGLSGSCADHVGKYMPVHDAADNDSGYTLMEPNQQTRGNSDWATSQTFPDPYSCATCHPSS
ncbi:hypothetical protein [Ferrimonas sp. SCSIO 43195]|uniref:hypothetical protein n=1 Tax=Ferrimonas sp. SCSIO 43195 TaxID=2822844 RepID=UPI002075D7FC|nr:hypothetical protein [Ferrimonas sp. SCSIO 43195]USD38543.1 hypothetical protein J8Z22_05295 [Ferrimonas sp. SCSIO 43195]